ncbi:MAG: alanine racemase [Chthonomonadales bacterium]
MKSLPPQPDTANLRTWAEIDLRAIRSNVAAIRDLIGPGVNIMAVVKDNAYGHGAEVMTNVAIEAGAIYVGTATEEEGVAIRQNGVTAPIVALSPFSFELASEFDIEVLISQREQLMELRNSIRRPAVHIEIETGMGRSGVSPANAADFAKDCVDAGLEIKGLCTHFSDAEGDPEGSTRQIKLFEQALAALKPIMPAEVLIHASNSAGTLNLPFSHYDMVRPGLLLYGISPYVDRPLPPPFKPVLSLKARIGMIRTLAKGAGISYGSDHILRRDSRVATLTSGYALGYPRALGNSGEVIIAGKRAPILGRICMDVMMVDVSDIPAAIVGDIITLIGNDGNESIFAYELAGLVRTTPHAITTLLSPDLPKIYLEP